MSFSKQASQLSQDLTNRDHPIYNEWNDWKEVCIKYHSEHTKLLQRMINRGVRDNNGEDITTLESNLIDEIYFKLYETDVIVGQGIDAVKDYFHNMKHTTFFKVGLCTCDNFEEDDYLWKFSELSCKNKVWHAKAFLISLLWAWVYKIKPSKSLRKYYSRLERTILSLNDQVLNFDLDLIVSPPKFRGRGRSLLKQLYSRGYFEKIEVQDIVQRFEELKYARQQSGENQSNIPSVYDEMIDCFSRLIARYPDINLRDNLLPIEQALFTIKHEHVWQDCDMNRLKETISEAKDEFLGGFKTTMISCAKHLTVMFLVASTIALLTRAVVSIAGEVIMKLLHFLYSFICGPSYKNKIDYSECAVQQSNSEGLNIPFVPTIILDYIISPPANILSKLWASKETDNIMRRLAYLPRSHQGLEQLVNWMSDIMFNLKRWYSKEVLGKEIMEDINCPNHKIKLWNNEIDKIVKSYYNNTFSWSSTNQAHCYKLYSDGVEYGRNSVYKKWQPDIMKSVNKLGNILEIFKQKMGGEGTIRNPPVTIYLTGDTGVGKSSLTYPFAAETLKKITEAEKSEVNLIENWESMIYMRCPEQEYWDGYKKQFVTIFDDFSQRVDSAANPNLELFEIIRASNCFPYPLHMAALDQKANTTFESKIIIVSSNLAKPDCHSLNFPDALHRRFDVAVKVKRKPGLKLPKGSGFRPDIYTFTQYDIGSGAELREISYDDLIIMSVCAYMERTNYVNSIESYIKSKLSEPAVEVGEIAKEQMFEGVKDFAISTSSVIGNKINDFKCDVSQWWEKDPINKAWIGLKGATERLEKSYVEIQEYWDVFRKEHQYLSNVVIGIGLLITGLMFLRIFFKIKGMVKPKNNNMITPEAFEEGYGDKYNPVARREAYGDKYNPVAKREAYGDKHNPVAKREGYNPVSQRVPMRESRARLENEIACEQGVKDLNAAEILMKIARSNMYKMYISSTGKPIGHVFFLKGKICMMPKHYKSVMDALVLHNEESTVYFEAVLLRRGFECKVSDILKSVRSFGSPDEKHGPVYSRDLMAVVVSTAIIHTDSTPFFCSRRSVSEVDSTSVMLPVLVKNNISDSERSILMLRCSEGRSQLARKEELAIYDEDRKLVRYVRDAWAYNMDTQGSECGAPLLVRNTQIRPGKICGMHIAGIEGTGQGFSTPIYKEDVEEIIKSFPLDVKYSRVFEVKLNEYPIEQCQVPDKAEFLRLGSLEKPLPQPGSTKIEPSLAHASYKEPETKPCLLRPAEVNGEMFDPRAYRIGRLGNIPEVIDQGLVNNSRDAFVDELSQVISQSVDIRDSNVKGVYTFDEAVLGIDGDLYVNSVKRNTSPGFPFVQRAGFKSRQEIFGSAEVYDLKTPQALELRDRVSYIIKQAKLGNVLDHYFMDTLKDERKPIHKAHKTRLFAAGPLDYLIACKMYFNGVVALLQRNRNWSHVSVGTNPYSLDWGEIVATLKRKADNMVAGDFEGFDASQHQILLEAAGEVLISLAKRFLEISEEDETVMRVLLVSLWNSLHITGKEVYQWTHSLPSGHYLTAIINSLFVNISFGCVWQIAKKRISYLSARMFWEKCGIVAYGDDHVVSIPDSELGNFNQLVLGDLFKLIGLSYTLEDKDAVAEKESRDISEVSYLKRNFVRAESLNRWIAPLSLQTVLESPMWIHKCPDRKIQTIANLENSLKELSLHDKETWTKWAPKLRAECVKLGHYTVLQNQEEVRNICLDQEFEM